MTEFEANKAKSTPNRMRDIDRRLKLSQDPIKVAGTKLHADHKAQSEAAAVTRRKRKAEAAGINYSTSSVKIGTAPKNGLADPFANDPSAKQGAGGDLFSDEATKRQKTESAAALIVD